MDDEEVSVEGDVRGVAQATEQALVGGAVCLVPRDVFLKLGADIGGKAAFRAFPVRFQFFGWRRVRTRNSLCLTQLVCCRLLWRFCLKKTKIQKLLYRLSPWKSKC